MDIQKIAMQLIKFLGQNPQLITQFIQHPYSTTAQATGSNTQYSREDMSQIVTAAAALSNNQQLPNNDIANIASALLGQNNNSIHSLTSMLFGGGNTAQATQAAQAHTTSAGTLDLGSLVSLASLATTLMGGAQQAQQPQQQPVVVQQQVAPRPQIDLSDGLSVGEIALLASQFLSANNSTTTSTTAPTTVTVTPKPQQVQVQPQQAAAPSLDFGTIAQLASIFLKKQ